MIIIEDFVNNNQHNPRAAIEHHCMIENIIYESIGEGKIGMQLVAEVTLNRVDNQRYGKSPEEICEVVYQRKQFSWTAIPEEERLVYTDDEYMQAAQVMYSVLYDELPRILPENVLHYLNRRDATDLSWYDPNKVVYAHLNHEFLKL